MNRTIPRRSILAASLLGTGAVLARPALAQSQSWANRPIRVIVGYAPGGLTDLIARLIGPALTAELGQPVVVENLGVLVDSLHLDRCGGVPTDLSVLDPAEMSFAQICDARRLSAPLSDAARMREARTARLPLGEGDLPLFDFMDALPEGIELEYEVARADLADASALDRALAAKRDADRFLALYRNRPRG